MSRSVSWLLLLLLQAIAAQAGVFSREAIEPEPLERGERPGGLEVRNLRGQQAPLWYRFTFKLIAFGRKSTEM